MNFYREDIKNDMRELVLPKLMDNMRSSGVKSSNDQLRDKFIKLYPHHANPDVGFKFYKYEYEALSNANNATVAQNILNNIDRELTHSMGSDYIEKALQTIRANTQVSFEGDLIHTYLTLSRLTQKQNLMENDTDLYVRIQHNIKTLIENNLLPRVPILLYIHERLNNTPNVDIYNIANDMIRMINSKVYEIKNNIRTTVHQQSTKKMLLKDILIQLDNNLVSFILTANGTYQNLLTELKKDYKDVDISEEDDHILHSILNNNFDYDNEPILQIMFLCDSFLGNNKQGLVQYLFNGNKINIPIQQRIYTFMQNLKENLYVSIEEAYDKFSGFNIKNLLKDNLHLNQNHTGKHIQQREHHHPKNSFSNELLNTMAYIMMKFITVNNNT